MEAAVKGTDCLQAVHYSNRGQKGFCHPFFVDARKSTLKDNVGKGKGVAGKGQRNEEVT